MKVRELIAELNTRDPDAVVVLARDGEGNDFSPLGDTGPPGERFAAGDRAVIPSGPDGPEQPDPAYADEWPDDAIPCVSLWP